MRALCVVGLPSVAEVFADLLRLGPVRPRAIEFFARFPELASVLEPLAKQKTRHGKLAQSVLEGLPKRDADAPRAESSAVRRMTAKKQRRMRSNARQFARLGSS